MEARMSSTLEAVLMLPRRRSVTWAGDSLGTERRNPKIFMQSSLMMM